MSDVTCQERFTQLHLISSSLLRLAETDSYQPEHTNIYHSTKTDNIIMSPHQIPSEQWAQVIEKDGDTKTVYKKIPVEKPGPDEVLVNIKYTGVCHTDLHALHGDWPLDRKLPLIGGHEGAGVVVAKGDLVKDIEVSCLIRRRQKLLPHYHLLLLLSHSLPLA